jgi:hypothetical protein
MSLNYTSIAICWILFVTCIVISCSQDTQQNLNKTFIVPSDTIPVYNKSKSEIPPPPPPNRAYYFPSNFIIDTAGQVFFYPQPPVWHDDGIRNWNAPPKFINLKPNDIILILDDNLEEFITHNILNLDSSKRYVAIAPVKDTITSIGLAKMFIMCKEAKNHIRWKFRIATQEEVIVLDYKKRQANYSPDEIKWDSTKIIMPQTNK